MATRSQIASKRESEVAFRKQRPSQPVQLDQPKPKNLIALAFLKLFERQKAKEEQAKEEQQKRVQFSDPYEEEGDDKEESEIEAAGN